ncbi:MAG: endonuclease/exonuclease/phosphatase family protein [Candidatus Nanopelagicales bacterium]
MRVATFNLLHGRALDDGFADPQRLRDAATRIDADVIGLQEVDRYQERSGTVDQTEIVASALRAPDWRFVPAVHGTPGPRVTWTPATAANGADTVGATYGIGMASRWPVQEWRVLRFPAAPLSLPLLTPVAGGARFVRIPDEPRVAMAAVVDGPTGPLTVATAHLTFVPLYNARQLHTLVRWLDGLPRPALLAGDFNLPGALPRRLTGWTQLVRAATYPSWNPRVQFDHVLADGLPQRAVRGARVVRLPLSDHAALVVEIDL